MILHHGVVRVEEGKVYVDNFRFDGVDLVQARIEALEWAISRLTYARDDLKLYGPKSYAVQG